MDNFASGNSGSEFSNSNPIEGGTCMLMCSYEEMRERQKENLFHKLECKLNHKGERLKVVDQKCMVKMFSRSAAGQKIKSSDVRPLPTLQRTVAYLLSVVCVHDDVSWLKIYDFVNDRLRAVRKDIEVQDLSSMKVVDVLTPAARFYIYANYRLCEEKLSNFDSKLNQKQLDGILLTILHIFKKNSYESDDSECGKSSFVFESDESSSDSDEGESEIPDMDNLVSSLNNCQIDNSFSDMDTSYGGYNDDSREFLPYTNIRNMSDNVQAHNAANRENSPKKVPKSKAKKKNTIEKYSVMEEMISLYVLIHLDEPKIIADIFEMPEKIRKSVLVLRVLSASLGWLCGNHFPLVRLARTAPPLLAAAIHLHLAKVQRRALEVLSVSHQSRLRYSVSDLHQSLLFASESSTAQACTYFGMEVDESEGVLFSKEAFKLQSHVRCPEKAPWIDGKMASVPLPKLLLG